MNEGVGERELQPSFESTLEPRYPALTSRWLREAVEKARSAFEREMERDRRKLDERFDEFWKGRAARGD